MTRAGLPHSEILGSKDVCSSPRLIAACHVLHRLLAPRHPPYALHNLTKKRQRCIFHVRSIELSKSCLSGQGGQKLLVQACQTSREYSGGDNRARTGDLLRAKQALSQLSYIPETPWSLVGLRGVEPLTSRLSGVRSNHS